MPDFELSLHAIEQIERRGISQETVFDVLNTPDKIEIEEGGQLIYQKNMMNDDGKICLVRVFVNSNKKPNMVKTAYKTSKYK